VNAGGSDAMSSGGSSGAISDAGTSHPTMDAGGTNAAGANAGGMDAGHTTTCSNASEPTLTASTTTAAVDVAQSWGNLPHFWSAFGVGRMGLFLQAKDNWGEILKGHLKDSVRDLGLDRIRGHGIFHDDLGIYHEVAGQPVYDFTKADQVMDFLKDAGVAPIVEFGGTPHDLARDPSQTVMAWKMIRSPPKDFGKWRDLIFAFVKHYRDRYGDAELDRWRYEVWNEADLQYQSPGAFWTGTLDEYFQLYDYTVAGALAAYPNAKVGGPVASNPAPLWSANSGIGATWAGTQFGSAFLSHVKTKNYATGGTSTPLHWFSYHSWLFLQSGVNDYFTAQKLLADNGFPNLETSITEFGPTWQFGLDPEPQETTQGAAFVAQTMANLATRCHAQGATLPWAYAWWTISDIFDEGTDRADYPFVGGMGLTSRDGIRKPAYNAFRLLNQMGREQLAFSSSATPGVGGFAAKDAAGGVQVLLYNGNSPGPGPDKGPYYAVTTTPAVINVTIDHLDPSRPYDYALYRVDPDHGNAFAAWEAMGKPAKAAISSAQWDQLRAAMQVEPLEVAKGICKKQIQRSISLVSPGIALITLTPSP